MSAPSACKPASHQRVLAQCALARRRPGVSMPRRTYGTSASASARGRAKTVGAPVRRRIASERIARGAHCGAPVAPPVVRRGGAAPSASRAASRGGAQAPAVGTVPSADNGRLISGQPRSCASVALARAAPPMSSAGEHEQLRARIGGSVPSPSRAHAAPRPSRTSRGPARVRDAAIRAANCAATGAIAEPLLERRFARRASGSTSASRPRGASDAPRRQRGTHRSARSRAAGARARR